MNVHTPERQKPEESQADYRARRQRSRLIIERQTRPHLFTGEGDRIHFDPRWKTAQGMNPLTGVFAVLAKAARAAYQRATRGAA